LSGLMAGWVYTRKRRAGGPGALWSAAVGRARLIYAWHAAAFAAAFLCVKATEYACGFCSMDVPRLFFEHPAAALGLGLTLLYQPGLLDLLPMYCGFVILLPAVICGLESGRRRIVLAPSAAAWLPAQRAAPPYAARIPPGHRG